MISFNAIIALISDEPAGKDNRKATSRSQTELFDVGKK